MNQVLSYVEFGDHVFCNDCETEMILPGGADVCPICGSVGCMSWAKDVEGCQITEEQCSEDDLENVVIKFMSEDYWPWAEDDD